MASYIERRKLLAALGGASTAWPLAARAQQGERMRHIGVLMASAADDSENQACMAAFLQGLAQLGWTDGRNVRIETRWATTNADDLRRHAAELAALAPDVLVAATGTATVAPLLQATRTLPIVFVVVIDPVGAGFVASLARPGGNATGFTMFEYGLSGKWLELLKQIVPSITRAAVLRDPAVARRSHPQGREARRPTGTGADQVRAGSQPQDRKGAWPRRAGGTARARRRGNRMT